jgi:hypothetical protein
VARQRRGCCARPATIVSRPRCSSATPKSHADTATLPVRDERASVQASEQGRPRRRVTEQGGPPA